MKMMASIDVPIVINFDVGQVEELIKKHLAEHDCVEVVRCKDCKHLYCLSAVDRRFYCRHWPKGLEGINVVEENPFCSYGERKDGDVHE